MAQFLWGFVQLFTNIQYTWHGLFIQDSTMTTVWPSLYTQQNMVKVSTEWGKTPCLRVFGGLGMKYDKMQFLRIERPWTFQTWFQTCWVLRTSHVPSTMPAQRRPRMRIERERRKLPKRFDLVTVWVWCFVLVVWLIYIYTYIHIYIYNHL